MTVANAVTGSRLFFFVLFIGAASWQRVDLAVMFWLPAWGLDAVDGWLARVLKQESRLGFVFDKAADRLILFTGVLIALMEELAPDYALLLLTKDIAILPALSWQAVHRRHTMPSIGRLGKTMAVAQGVGFLWLLLGWPGGFILTVIIALVGGAVGAKYLIDF